MTDVTKLLADSQQREYVENGIVFPIRVLSPQEADQFRANCDELEQLLGGKPRSVEVRQMHLHYRWAYDLATHPRVLDAVEDLLGPNLLVWTTELFSKHPQDGAVSIGWHQDHSYMGFDSGDSVTAWIALADSSVENGCMRAFPGPDRRQAAETGGARHGEAAQAGKRVSSIQVKEAEAISVVLHAGEMSLHDVYIVHGSGPNCSQHKRVGFVVRFITPETRPRQGRPPAILARGRDRHGHFQLVALPIEQSPEQSLKEMRESAQRHFDVMLENLKQSKR